MARKKQIATGATKLLATGVGVAISRVASKFITGTSVASLESRPNALLKPESPIVKFVPLAKLALGAGIAMSTKNQNVMCFGMGMAGDSLIEATNGFTNNAIGTLKNPYSYRSPYGLKNPTRVRQIPSGYNTRGRNVASVSGGNAFGY